MRQSKTTNYPATMQAEPFKFDYPITTRRVVNLKVVSEVITVVTVEGTCSHARNASETDPLEWRIRLDIDYIYEQGKEKSSLLRDVFQEHAEDLMAKITTRAFQLAEEILFPEPAMVKEAPEFMLSVYERITL
jgi:hypothetical protein